MSYRYDAASQALPWIAGVLAAALAGIDGIMQRRAQRRGKGDGSLAMGSVNTPAVRSELMAVAWIAAFLPLVFLFGFYAAVLLYVFCYLRLYGGKTGPGAALAAFVVSAFLYIVFGLLMGYEIFGGVLGGDSL
jgi:hypothetical protein